MNRVGAYRPQRRTGTYMSAARGVYQAGKILYKNRQKIAAVAKKFVPNKRRKVQQGPARRLGYGGGAATTVVGSASGPGHELTTYRRSVGRYPPLRPNRLLQLVQAGMTQQIFRAQGLTNFDVNVGFYNLGNRINTAQTAVLTPIHIWDLSIFENVSADIVAGRLYYWNGVTTSADIVSAPLPTQTSTGTTSLLGYYQSESAAGVVENGTPPKASKAMHDWSQIKLNLYGARKRGTTFYVDVMRVTDTLAHPIVAAQGNRAKKDLFRTLQAPLVYSNLQSHNNKNLRAVKFVKRWKFYVPGGTADDLDTIGKVKEVSLFLKQGRVYNMMAESSDGTEALPHNHEDGLDYTLSAGPSNFPYHGSRLMLMIRAFAPERVVQNDFNTPADPLIEPSYDLLLRNKFMLPN